MPTTGSKIGNTHRQELLERLPPKWPKVIADHSTLDAHVDTDGQFPNATRAKIVGGIEGGKGLQTTVVAIDPPIPISITPARFG